MATSVRTEERARELGIPVEPFDTLDRLDLAIDGADQISPDGWLVKGGGAAHTREKIVAAAADRFVVIASSDKPVDRLRAAGAARAAGLRPPGHAARRSAARSCATSRRSPDGGVIADYTGRVDDPQALAAYFDATPGIVEHGLFPPTLVYEILVGRGDRVQRLVPPT